MTINKAVVMTGFALALACDGPEAVPGPVVAAAPKAVPAAECPEPPAADPSRCVTAAEAGDKDVLTARVLSTAGARRVLHGGLAEIRTRGVTGAIAVVDPTGHVVAYARADGTFPAADEVSIGKARTAAIFRKPTRFFEEVITGGRPPMLAIPEFTPMAGGVPIVVEGQIVGAVGVAGASSADEDEELAKIAAAVIGTAGPSVIPEAAEGAEGELGLGLALEVLAAARTFAEGRSTTGGIAVADGRGRLVAFERVEGTFVAGDVVSWGKARTAVLFAKPTRVFEEIITKGRLTMLKIDQFTPMQGGIPLVVDGTVIGGIGVSGASSAPEDEEIAIAGAAVVSTR